MATLSRVITGILLIFSVTAVAESAQSIGSPNRNPILTIGGNPLVNRSFVDSIGSFLVDIHHPFTQAGPLTHWEIYAVNTNPVQLVIYREQNGAFVEVGRGAVETPALGYNLFRLAKPIHVRPGDFIGANQPAANGAIAFSLDGTETDPTCVENLERTTLLAFHDGSSTNFVCSSNRSYSLRAYGPIDSGLRR